jgi:hypothetical protein
VRTKRTWLAYFVVLAVLGAAALVIPIVYNLGLQLRPEQLAQARDRWGLRRPADYDLHVLRRATNAEGGEDTVESVIEVRAGRVVLVGEEHEVLYGDPSLAVLAGPGLLALPPADLRGYGVEALFDEMEAALRANAASGAHNYLTATFDPDSGHPTRYVRRIRGSRERVEVLVRLDRR